ncbi:amidase domain-containing protein [Thalassobacillus sp. CUG 92003]|uniref:amidase domain-containing protein n=1 Tax=Thalassobacillus sp. CUG 92003 TaxID=2736641 RepID=UPI0015E748F7|nr:amidase domain-containing protein [Thalassobacillus sp. CUG 92003]
MRVSDQLCEYWQDILSQSDRSKQPQPWLTKKIDGYQKQNQRLVKVNGDIFPFQRMKEGDEEHIHYQLYLTFLLRHQGAFYQEECQMVGKARVTNHDIVVLPVETEAPESLNEMPERSLELSEEGEIRFTYDRRAAVRYAENWWDSYNPAYQKFTDDCTNYISQCLRAGGAPMWGQPNRSKGWWYSGNTWSFSWSVANALRWYLSGSKQGMTAREMESAEELIPGDVICYDFQGDGRWDHNTIVVMKNSEGMPLVNAHTSNSRHRYWDYEDSTAYTPNIQYKFFRIGP